jgi:FdhE protein
VSDCPNELIYACEQCRQYLPCLDMVEKSENVDFDLAALGLVHLDAAAQSRGYTPLSPAPWSAFGFAQEKVKVS